MICVCWVSLAISSQRNGCNRNFVRATILRTIKEIRLLIPCATNDGTGKNLRAAYSEPFALLNFKKVLNNNSRLTLLQIVLDATKDAH